MMGKIGMRFLVRDDGPRVDLIAHLASLAGSPDCALASEGDGFGFIGEQPCSRLWRRKPDGVRLSSEELKSRISAVLANHWQERSRGHFRLPSPRDRRRLLTQLREEARRGWWETESPLADIEAKYGDFCLLLYFGVEQGSKLRGCVDPSEISTLPSLLEVTYMAGVDGVVGAMQEIQAVWSPDGLLLFKEDWDAGYRSLRLLETDRRFFVAAAKDESGEIVGFVPKMLLFGPSRCTPQFSRVSEAFERILAGHLWVVLTHH